MNKRKTAEKYLRDGGCGDIDCGDCAFHKKCFRAYLWDSSTIYGLKIARAYLAKKEKKMKKDDGWKDIDRFNIPSDIFDLTKWERQVADKGQFTVYSKSTTLCLDFERFKYRYRPIQKAQVSHEEIMTLWWLHRGVWIKVIKTTYSEDLKRQRYYIDSSWVGDAWFIGKESATIPPGEEDK